MQPWKDNEVLEIGYLFQRRYWHKGYATEAARACKKYAFEILNAQEVCFIIRDTNIASQNVAVRKGMTVTDSTTEVWICFIIALWRFADMGMPQHFYQYI